jgi:hypothetical protein
MSSWTFTSHSSSGTHSETHTKTVSSHGTIGGAEATGSMTPEQQVEHQRRVEIARRRKLQEQEASKKTKPSKFQQIRDVSDPTHKKQKIQKIITLKKSNQIKYTIWSFCLCVVV